MPTLELQTFFDASKAKGASDDLLAALLTRRGWPADDVYSALGSYWESVTGVAIPSRGAAGESARDAFLYLLSFATLGTWAMALGSMLFQLIDRWLPDAVAHLGYSDFRSQTTWQMASMLVAFPIYLLATRAIAREAGQHPERLQSGVRKWLTYIALLITAGTMIGDLICFLDYFLAGELTARFVLKVIAVMGISGAIFAYYIGWLRSNRARNLPFGIPATVVVATTFCIGLAAAGTPAQQRQIAADRTRVQDLRNLATALKIVYDSGQGLPASTSNLHTRRTDPERGIAYEYRLTGASTYELCAAFTGESSDNQPSFWAHGKGRQCFEVNAAKMAPW